MMAGDVAQLVDCLPSVQKTGLDVQHHINQV